MFLSLKNISAAILSQKYRLCQRPFPEDLRPVAFFEGKEVETSGEALNYKKHRILEGAEPSWPFKVPY